MGSGRGQHGLSRSLSSTTSNKLRRQALYIENKRAADKARHKERHNRQREEDKNPELRRARLERNVPATLDSKRVWDEGDDESLGRAVDLAQARRRRLEEEEAEAAKEADGDEDDEDDEDVDSMLGSDLEDDNEDDEESSETERANVRRRQRTQQRDSSLAPSTTSTNLDLTPSSLALRFPNLFPDDSAPPPPSPKILITTSLNATIHREAQDIGELFPHSVYIPRSAHRYGHKYSVREICRFAANRNYTAVVVVGEDRKTPTRLSVVHLPEGPTLTYTISRYTAGKRLPGHGNPTNHYPELLLNNFKTSLGLLVAKSFATLFPPQPEVQGRQVVTLHNQRDYLFVRRHRYVVREKRQTERSVVGVDGKELKGVEGVRVGLQELGPRFTMKLRRVDKGVGWAGSEGDDPMPWQWKAKMEKKRTRFNL